MSQSSVPNLHLGTDAVPSPGGLEVPDVLADHVLPPVPQDLLRRVVTPHNLVNNKYFFSPTKIFFGSIFFWTKDPDGPRRHQRSAHEEEKETKVVDKAYKGFSLNGLKCLRSIETAGPKVGRLYLVFVVCDLDNVRAVVQR